MVLCDKQLGSRSNNGCVLVSLRHQSAITSSMTSSMKFSNSSERGTYEDENDYLLELLGSLSKLQSLIEYWEDGLKGACRARLKAVGIRPPYATRVRSDGSNDEAYNSDDWEDPTPVASLDIEWRWALAASSNGHVCTQHRTPQH